MEWSTIQDGICFIRPLLSVNKDDIIAFAKANNISFLPNSTPTWSQRGQIRNSIVPCLDKWNTRFVPSLFALTDTLKELHNILQARVCEFIEQGSISDTISHKTFIITITLKSLPCEIMFWREFLLETFKIHVSSKSLDSMSITLEKIKLEDKDIPTRKIVLRKGLCLVIESINTLKVKLTISDIH
jgi:tRNA(Ile)-lysidine synthase TilS/MesJ